MVIKTDGDPDPIHVRFTASVELARKSGLTLIGRARGAIRCVGR